MVGNTISPETRLDENFAGSGNTFEVLCIPAAQRERQTDASFPRGKHWSRIADVVRPAGSTGHPFQGEQE
ncbi:MAG: hypothetical protein JXB36_08655 [Gammaproteobacteria bacterium]|nr:hypothetical protein [Gammaproteobacteria bacterium]